VHGVSWFLTGLRVKGLIEEFGREDFLNSAEAE
jgi:hypothetical protein